MKTYDVEHDGKSFTWQGAGPRVVAGEVVRAYEIPEGETLTVSTAWGYGHVFESTGRTARPVGVTS